MAASDNSNSLYHHKILMQFITMGHIMNDYIALLTVHRDLYVPQGMTIDRSLQIAASPTVKSRPECNDKFENKSCNKACLFLSVVTL